MRCLPSWPGQRARIRLRVAARLLLGPLAVASLAAVELRGHGAFTAAAGAYFTFAVTQIAVDLWTRWQLQLARRRLAHARERSKQPRTPSPRRQ